MHHALDLQDEVMMGSLTPAAGRMRTCLCPIEAGPFALDSPAAMTRFPEPCDKIDITLARSCRRTLQSRSRVTYNGRRLGRGEDSQLGRSVQDYEPFTNWVTGWTLSGQWLRFQTKLCHVIHTFLMLVSLGPQQSPLKIFNTYVRHNVSDDIMVLNLLQGSIRYFNCLSS
jgi:hypothetical protein